MYNMLLMLTAWVYTALYIMQIPMACVLFTGFRILIEAIRMPLMDTTLLLMMDSTLAVYQ